MRDRAIADSLRAFGEARAGTLHLAADLTPDQANYAPGPDRWSVAQNLDHLLLTETLYRAQIERLLELAREGKGLNIDVSLREVDLNLPFIPRALMPMMSTPLTVMNMFMPHAVRETLLRFPVMKAKNPMVAEPAAAKPIGELRRCLASSLAETEALFAGELPDNAGRVTATHPVFGRNTIAKILALVTAHEERHGTQIGSVLRHRGFPAITK
jgi:uncharacterized damage-inducible protein DinB